METDAASAQEEQQNVFVKGPDLNSVAEAEPMEGTEEEAVEAKQDGEEEIEAMLLEGAEEKKEGAEEKKEEAAETAEKPIVSNGTDATPSKEAGKESEKKEEEVMEEEEEEEKPKSEEEILKNAKRLSINLIRRSMAYSRSEKSVRVMPFCTEYLSRDYIMNYIKAAKYAHFQSAQVSGDFGWLHMEFSSYADARKCREHLVKEFGEDSVFRGTLSHAHNLGSMVSQKYKKFPDNTEEANPCVLTGNMYYTQAKSESQMTGKLKDEIRDSIANYFPTNDAVGFNKAEDNVWVVIVQFPCKEFAIQALNELPNQTITLLDKEIKMRAYDKTYWGTIVQQARINEVIKPVLEVKERQDIVQKTIQLRLRISKLENKTEKVGEEEKTEKEGEEKTEKEGGEKTEKEGEEKKTEKEGEEKETEKEGEEKEKEKEEEKAENDGVKEDTEKEGVKEDTEKDGDAEETEKDGDEEEKKEKEGDKKEKKEKEGDKKEKAENHEDKARKLKISELTKELEMLEKRLDEDDKQRAFRNLCPLKRLKNLTPYIVGSVEERLAVAAIAEKTAINDAELTADRERMFGKTLTHDKTRRGSRAGGVRGREGDTTKGPIAKKPRTATSSSNDTGSARKLIDDRDRREPRPARPSYPSSRNERDYRRTSRTRDTDRRESRDERRLPARLRDDRDDDIPSDRDRRPRYNEDRSRDRVRSRERDRSRGRDRSRSGYSDYRSGGGASSSRRGGDDRSHRGDDFNPQLKQLASMVADPNQLNAVSMLMELTKTLGQQQSTGNVNPRPPPVDIDQGYRGSEPRYSSSVGSNRGHGGGSDRGYGGSNDRGYGGSSDRGYAQPASSSQGSNIWSQNQGYGSADRSGGILPAPSPARHPPAPESYRHPPPDPYSSTRPANDRGSYY